MSQPEFTAVILAATCGSRLYPLTIDDYDDYLPKHLLPLAGRPILHHLLEKLQQSNLQHVIIAISSIDKVTIPNLIEMGAKKQMNSSNINNNDTGDVIVQCFELSSSLDEKNTTKNIVQVVTLPSDCSGSADALRFIGSIQGGETSPSSINTSNEMRDDGVSVPVVNKQSLKSNSGGNGLIPNGSHIMVMSADLVLYGDLDDEMNKSNDSTTTRNTTATAEDTLGSLADVHRDNYHLGVIGEGPPLAMTVVLSDVGECDSNGIPLKESAKAKKGGLSREDGDIEYVALSEVKTNNSSAQRIILKRSKFNVEKDEDITGKTPKLELPKSRLHAPIHQISIGKDWNDVHLYCLSPWVMKIIMTKVHLKDLAKEVLPLLVESQFKGIKACLGITEFDDSADDDDDVEKKDDNVDDEKVQVLTQLLTDVPFAKKHNLVALGGSVEGDDDMNTSNKVDVKRDHTFTVMAKTLPHSLSKLTLRACNVSYYSYACREVVSQAVKSDTSKLSLPSEAEVDTKFGSVIMPNCTFGEKVQIKSSTIGKNVTVGNRCRLNNVVVMDDVKIGQNCILQNSVISRGCTIEDNCNLNDCQLRPKCLLEHGTKGKGESYT